MNTPGKTEQCPQVAQSITWNLFLAKDVGAGEWGEWKGADCGGTQLWEVSRKNIGIKGKVVKRI